MIKTLSSIAVAALVAFTVSGCNGEQPKVTKVQQQATEDAQFKCKQESVFAPSWTCMPMADGAYAGVGIAEKSGAGMSHMRRVALANGRSDLAQQIKSQIKDKVETFTRVTGVGAGESVDSVTTAVSKQIAKVDLEGSKGVNVWTAPSGALYMLVTVSEKKANEEIKQNIQSSYKNDSALWQQFQSKNALEGLEKEFD